MNECDMHDIYHILVVRLLTLHFVVELFDHFVVRSLQFDNLFAIEFMQMFDGRIFGAAMAM